MTPENDDLGEPFKPEDFNSLPDDDMSIPWPQLFKAQISFMCHKELMKDAPKMYGVFGDDGEPPVGWFPNKFSNHIETHTCKIAPWTIRELKEEKE